MAAREHMLLLANPRWEEHQPLMLLKESGVESGVWRIMEGGENEDGAHGWLDRLGERGGRLIPSMTRS